jgi:hypothetical protein
MSWWEKAAPTFVKSELEAAEHVGARAAPQLDCPARRRAVADRWVEGGAGSTVM